MLTSVLLKTSSFPANTLSGLNHFSLTAYGLSSCCPTLNRRSYLHWPKDSLPGGWLDLPGRASHPLEYATLPGRTSGKYLKGFKLLTLGWCDGVTFLPLDFVLRSSAKAANRIQGIIKDLDKRTLAGISVVKRR